MILISEVIIEDIFKVCTNRGLKITHLNKLPLFFFSFFTKLDNKYNTRCYKRGAAYCCISFTLCLITFKWLQLFYIAINITNDDHNIRQVGNGSLDESQHQVDDASFALGHPSYSSLHLGSRLMDLDVYKLYKKQ